MSIVKDKITKETHNYKSKDGLIKYRFDVVEYWNCFEVKTYKDNILQATTNYYVDYPTLRYAITDCAAILGIIRDWN